MGTIDLTPMFVEALADFCYANNITILEEPSLPSKRWWQFWSIGHG